ncbi:MAG: hypothetical protein ABIZ64_17135 [Casimicrobium sp.]
MLNHQARRLRAPWRSFVPRLFAGLLPVLGLTVALAAGDDASLGIIELSNPTIAVAPRDPSILSRGFSSYRVAGLGGVSALDPAAAGGMVTAGYSHQKLNTHASDLLLLRLNSGVQTIWSTYALYATRAEQLVCPPLNLVATGDGAHIMWANLRVSTLISDARVVKFDDAAALFSTKFYICADPANSPQTGARVPINAGGTIVAIAVFDPNTN